MTGAIVTGPLDVVKTRLQSSQFRPTATGSRHGMSLWRPIADTRTALATIYRVEGLRALWKGLGANLVGVVPARAINFYAYGNGKRIIADYFNKGKESSAIHLVAAANAGIITATATNPIWLVKTRMQLQASKGADRYTSSWDCIKRVVKNEGIRGLYRGLSASYLGVTEGTIQWVLYERMKTSLSKRDSTVLESWSGKLGAAGGAKLFAALITYPHEVVRTRLRQNPENGALKYTGLWQCFKLVWKEEGIVALYGGLTAHLLRVVPNAAIMFFCYELVLSAGQ